ncbi:MAG: flagellar hook-associated protein FlgK [Alphaproteobacteria bacterium]|nr:flagellar hook-associated protein FlgK [Alphaproteobacteria bacterium]
MTVALNAALSGLRAAQRSLDAISNNISNATTEGYTRKILPQEALLINGEGQGVLMGALVRKVDAALIRDISRQVSATEGTLVRQRYLSRIDDFNGASEIELSLSSYIGRLSQSFSTLSSAPESQLELERTLTNAQETAAKFNDFSDMLTEMRDQTETEISDSLAIINTALEEIADLNIRISTLSGSGQSTASLEDQRDLAIRKISEHMEVSTFKSDNDKVTVMTRQGQVLVDETPRQLLFQPGSVLPTSYYPGGGLNGIFIDSFTGLEITNAGIGGRIGELLTLRDNTLPTYQAQLDEMAQKLAFRMDQQGLRLFTDANGAVPPNVAPPGITGYSGFAAQIQVNTDVANDPALIRQGTNGNTVLEGSNEVIRKISEFAFGPYAYQEGQGAVDISAGTLFATLGLTQTNRVIGTTTITGYTPSLDTHPDITAGAQFDITIGGGPAATVTINAGDTATDLVNNINIAVGSPVASLNGLGQLSISATANIGFSNVSIGAAGIAALGVSFGVTAAQDPSFTVQVGQQAPVTISISAADTSATLLTNLNLVAGLTATLGGGGELILTPTEGGDITLTETIGTPLTAMGMTINNIAHTPFRQTNVGPDGTLSTGLLTNASLESYGRSIITSMSEDARAASDQAEKDQSFLNFLDKRHLDQSGVNIDEEMASMIRIQSNYAAAARMVRASETMLDELMEAFS